MTRKQIKKLANELAELEMVHQNSSQISKEELIRIENRIMSITSQLMMDKHGLEAMCEIDQIVQQKLNKAKAKEID